MVKKFKLLGGFVHFSHAKDTQKRILILILSIVISCYSLFASPYSLSFSLSPNIAMKASRDGSEIRGYAEMLDYESFEANISFSYEVFDLMEVGASSAIVVHSSEYIKEGYYTTPLFLDISYTPEKDNVKYPITLSLGGYASFYGNSVSFGPAFRLSLAAIAPVSSILSIYARTTGEILLAFGNGSEVYWNMIPIALGARFNF